MQFKTERLLLRDFVEEDYPDLRVMDIEPLLQRYEKVLIPSEEDTRAYLLGAITEQGVQHRQSFKLALQILPDERVWGRITLKPLNSAIREWEIGWYLHPDIWGRGFAAEGAARMLRFAFEELGAHRVAAFCHAQNRQSARVMEKIGMRQEAHFRETLWWNGGWSDELLYAILEREWRLFIAQPGGEGSG